jgi:hypothetical protein
MVVTCGFAAVRRTSDRETPGQRKIVGVRGDLNTEAGVAGLVSAGSEVIPEIAPSALGRRVTDVGRENARGAAYGPVAALDRFGFA